MRFRLIDAAKKDFPSSVYARSSTSVRADLAWKERPACRRQRDDMVLLAHVRSPLPLNGTYGPAHGARTSRQWAYHRPQARRPADAREWAQGSGSGGSSDHRQPPAFRSPRTFWTRTSQRPGRTRSGAPTSPTCGPARAGSTSPSSSTCSPGASSAGQPAIGFTRNWHCRLCAGPSPCGVRSPASFTTRSAAAQYCSLD